MSIITLTATTLTLIPVAAGAGAGAGAGAAAAPRPLPPAPMSTSTDPVDTAAFLQRIARPARRDYRRHQVPASVTMAQAILESGWGRSRLASVDRNYFGIKCRDGDPGPIATGCRTYETSEYDRKRKRYYKVKAQFRVYAKLGGSFRDHGAFLRDNSRYAAAFRYSTEPDRFAKAIAAAGYATSPTYADSLIRLMRKYDLYRYDA